MAVNVGDILRNTPNIKRALDELKIIEAWKKLDIEKVKENAIPDKLEDSVLFVNVKNSVWAQQITLMRPQLIARLNEFCGSILVKDIKAKTGFTEEKIEKEPELPKKVCGRCSVEFKGEKNMCHVCEREVMEEQNNTVYRLVERNEKIGYDEAKDFAPQIKKDGFRKIKRNMNSFKKGKVAKSGRKK